MKQILLILVFCILGEKFYFILDKNLAKKIIQIVFSVYKTISTDEHSNAIDANYHEELVGRMTGVHHSSNNELKLAQDKIRQLEERINELEQRIPKKYGQVKFLNYQNRKRILVTGEKHVYSF